MSSGKELKIGWGTADLTPGEPVLVSGQFYARVSEGVMDPVTATALALESGGGGRLVMVSCDFVSIPDGLRDAVRARLAGLAPDLAPGDVFLSATHTHTGPEVRVESDNRLFGGGIVPTRFGVDLPVMDPAEYVAFAAARVAGAVRSAWTGRAPGGIGYGLAQATLGYNRRMCFYDGNARMYGNPDDPEFSHIEGGNDSNVNLLATFDRDRRLTGLMVNVACPAQVSMHEFLVSADYWHEARQELRRRLGEGLFVLAQNSAAGDQNPAHPRIMIGLRAQERMWRLAGRSQRQDMALRLADAVTGILPLVEKEIEFQPVLAHRAETVKLARRLLSEDDVREADAEAETWAARYEEIARDLEAHPEKRREKRWYRDITTAYRRMKWYQGVAGRFELQQKQPRLPVEIHVARLGDVAFATNPFEYYLDFGLQIKARSRALQTFLVQHAGFGTYLPTARAVAGKSYGAVPASTPVGPEGGRELARWTVGALNAFWPEDENAA